MNKTTVYLPQELKAALARTASELQRSEADLIREGIEFVVAKRSIPTPRTGFFDSGDGTLAERTDELLEGFGEL